MKLYNYERNKIKQYIIQREDSKNSQFGLSKVSNR